MLSATQFLARIKTHNLCILSHTSVLDGETAISLASRFAEQKNFYFLEGVDQGTLHYGLSYLAFDPFVKAKVLDSQRIQIQQEGTTTILQKNLYDYLNQTIAHYKLEDTNLPFHAGILGFLTYECAGFAEHIPFPPERALATPLAQLLIPKNIIIFNNQNSQITINRIIFKEQWMATNPQTLFESEKHTFDQLIQHIQNPSQNKLKPFAPPQNDTSEKDETQNIQFSIDQSQYITMVQQCKDYIRKGHIFQIQISRRAQTTAPINPFNTYRFLRQTNPSPFMFYLKLEDTYLIGSSPEILVGVENKNVTIRPLAGTRKRQSSSQTEAQIIHELLNDEKEKAEHIMLVDLARNDIGRTCLTGSVKVTELMSIEKYQHVIHIVSNVIGTLKPQYTAVDAFKYSFPAGTVSGTPKIRAMEIISELEHTQREFYSGSIVFFDFLGNLKSTLIIRSMFIKNNIIYTQAAAGIVADSIPENEFLETANKMRSSLRVMTLKTT